MKKYIIIFLAGISLAAAGSVFALSTPTCSISVNPSSIPLGVDTPVTITWNTTNANSNGVISTQLGALVQSGSRIVVINGKSTSFNIIAMSGTTLINSTGSYAYCSATVSTHSHSVI